MSPEALRRRMAHGNIYKAEKVDAALANYFRVGNLSALRELALLWLADRVEEGLDATAPTTASTPRGRPASGSSSPSPAAPRARPLLRRGARIASRGAGGELLAVHVARSDGLSGPPLRTLAALRRLTDELGGSWHTVAGSDPAEAILDVARGVNASQVVIGSTRRPRWRTLAVPSTAEEVIAHSGDIDVHVVTHSFGRVEDRVSATTASEPGGAGRLAARHRGRSPWSPGLLVLLRTARACRSTCCSTCSLTVAHRPPRRHRPAIVGAVVSSLVLNWFFTDPVGTLTISEPENAVALVVFVVVAAVVASVVHRAARRRDAALAGAAGVRGPRRPGPVPCSRRPTRCPSCWSTPWTCSAARRRPRRATHDPRPVDRRGRAPGTSRSATSPTPPSAQTVDDETELVLVGPVLPADEQRLVGAFVAHAAGLLTRERLVAEAGQARGLARDNRARTALLAAVSHDLRTPLAGIKAAICSLRQTEVTFSPEDEAQLLSRSRSPPTGSAVLIGNLLDMSRLQTGSITPHAGDLVDLEDVVEAARMPLLDGDRVRTRFDEGLPLVRADAGLLDRVLAQHPRERAAALPRPARGRRPGRAAGRPGADPGRRPRPGRTRRGQGPDLRAVPARR